MPDRTNHTLAWLLGRTRIECAGTRIDTRLPTGSAILLIWFLMAPGEPMRRDELAFSDAPWLAGDARSIA